MEYRIDFEAATFPDVREQMKDLIKTESGVTPGPRNRMAPEHEQADRLHKAATASPDIFAADTEIDMIRALSEEQGLPFVNLSDFRIGDPDILRLIPAEVAMNYKCLPLERKPDGSLMVAICTALTGSIPWLIANRTT